MQTSLDPSYLAKVISGQTGLEFVAKSGVDLEGQRWYLLQPQGLQAEHTFGIRTTLGWRRLQVEFEPGKFAGPLLEEMGKADGDGKSAFLSVLINCDRLGAQINLEINGVRFPLDSEQIWEQQWTRFILSMKKGQLEIGVDEGEHDSKLVCQWAGRFSSAIIAVLPTEEISGDTSSDVFGFPEGSVMEIKANRYERDRRNRAAAIAIHGTACKGCGLEMGTQYGPLATGYIEIHHITPLSELGTNYTINPALDLVPLCPNCHAVVHRQNPPLTVDELHELLND